MTPEQKTVLIATTLKAMEVAVQVKKNYHEKNLKQIQVLKKHLQKPISNADKLAQAKALFAAFGTEITPFFERMNMAQTGLFALLKQVIPATKIITTDN